MSASWRSRDGIQILRVPLGRARMRLRVCGCTALDDSGGENESWRSRDGLQVLRVPLRHLRMRMRLWSGTALDDTGGGRAAFSIATLALSYSPFVLSHFRAVHTWAEIARLSSSMRSSLRR